MVHKKKEKSTFIFTFQTLISLWLLAIPVPFYRFVSTKCNKPIPFYYSKIGDCSFPLSVIYIRPGEVLFITTTSCIPKHKKCLFHEHCKYSQSHRCIKVRTKPQKQKVQGKGLITTSPYK